jgi:16S rRNA (guanine(966)-N(2))-methyltransferase RsmD
VVRIISGSAKGRKLLSVPGTGTRPVTDRVKEALFNILGADVEDSAWLDLFAGTGSIGIEALSRGARNVVFTDKAHQAIATLRRNLELTGFAGRAEVLRTDALRYIAQAPANRRFDYIYVAPPQYQGIWADTLHALDEHPLLAEDGWVIVQIHPKELGRIRLETLVPLRERRYGSTLLLFYGRVEDETRDPGVGDAEAGADADAWDAAELAGDGDDGAATAAS